MYSIMVIVRGTGAAQAHTLDNGIRVITSAKIFVFIFFVSLFLLRFRLRKIKNFMGNAQIFRQLFLHSFTQTQP